MNRKAAPSKRVTRTSTRVEVSQGALRERLTDGHRRRRLPSGPPGKVRKRTVRTAPQPTTGGEAEVRDLTEPCCSANHRTNGLFIERTGRRWSGILPCLGEAALITWGTAQVPPTVVPYGLRPRPSLLRAVDGHCGVTLFAVCFIRCLLLRVSVPNSVRPRLRHTWSVELLQASL